MSFFMMFSTEDGNLEPPRVSLSAAIDAINSLSEALLHHRACSTRQLAESLVKACWQSFDVA
jgi:hypothetical protein